VNLNSVVAKFTACDSLLLKMELKCFISLTVTDAICVYVSTNSTLALSFV